jgi:hypothetical protein
MFRIIVICVITGFILHSCKNKSTVVAHQTNSTEMRSLDSSIHKGNYNIDSTFQIVTSPDVNNTTNQLLSIVVLNILKGDTAFSSHKVYNDVKWINDSVILLRKSKGIERTLTKSPISEPQNTKSNTVDKYFNCKSKCFITTIPSKSVMP